MRTYRCHNNVSDLDHGYTLEDCASYRPRRRGFQGSANHLQTDSAAVAIHGGEFIDYDSDTTCFDAGTGVIIVSDAKIRRHPSSTLSAGQVHFDRKTLKDMETV